MIVKDILVRSPLTEGPAVKIISISTNYIINKYKTLFNIDVTRFFKGLDRVSLYECLETGYQFFCPFWCAGDDVFYQMMMELPWYYLDKKWEFYKALEWLNRDDVVLEIGCGRGEFIRIATGKVKQIVGLEINSKAVLEALNKGLNVIMGDIQQLLERKLKFDVICLFQLLEHIPYTKNFIDMCIHLLTDQGRLIISVPNQCSFFGIDDSNLLDLPPHHMNRWNERVLIKMVKFFPLELQEILFEPLMSYHLDHFNYVVNTYIDDRRIRFNLLNLVDENPSCLRGATCMALFSKL